MSWRRKPASHLEYWSGGTPSRTKADGFRTILVYCLGPAKPKTYHDRCHHQSSLKLDERWNVDNGRVAASGAKRPFQTSPASSAGRARRLQ
jgi:hypothetical protein